ncbi:hypothetical protein GCM10011497_04610 [Elstera cyanobacteriorum]|uniref:hypothetical protein n=1 Tax=Elstera cyanobacteriorum TaxID=2022747 RepID=UPI00114086DA|nr:hypothetical protein [Elstera cyanobacteriorum]GFZ79485.1 hypothetical protein GCM10011497_04610 [Elstera cyanobacteriorum]
MAVWKHIIDRRSGYLFNLSESLRIAENQYHDMLASVDSGAMIIASDYSGQHKEASHEAYSFLVTTDEALREWLPSLIEFRKQWLPDGRRISYKKLNEPVRWRALPAFLNTVGNLKGNLITVLIDKRIGSFMLGGPEAIIRSFPDCFDVNSNRGTVEKMLRLASFVAFILAGLRSENQISNWISDHDEALDSHDKREKFARLASYLTFGFTGWRQPADHQFGTTESPIAPYWSEDVAAIADLAAGAYCQLSRFLPAFLGVEAWLIKLDASNIESRRASTIGNWLATNRGSFKHALLWLEQDEKGAIRASTQAFIGH